MKLLALLLGIAAFLLAIGNLGSIILFALSAWLLWLVWKQFVKAPSTGGKTSWGIVGAIIILVMLGNLQAVIGLAAVYVLYVLIRSWKENEQGGMHHA
ncbi:flagellar basal body rod protein [Alkalicoccus luteus]|uniref:Flagellar basal body rod protein n=1 Tax=Alkalicoccus luteus TaxID=1237094 RepID=A0A969TSM9_9BACI|nr:flagellar basal body rod protein [Alkalicoccus luteus]NJP36743.1 flagellar basal body rod protein [Alkalicoccus luteus]